jgi:hypothetical protein
MVTLHILLDKLQISNRASHKEIRIKNLEFFLQCKSSFQAFMNRNKFCIMPIRPFKEVLRREIQGLKVYTVDRSSVFSMTGTYF